ncbi:MAG: transporter substrate-binding domain-containing protein [Oligoflexales bacterium]|nr:transporter substrate-binding domain-containing protein [Oligoflexales bacterium]
MYWQRDEKGNKTEKIVGYTVDLLSRVLKDANINTKFFLPPWKRCLEKSVDNSQYTIALDASYSKDREKKYLLTRDYYHITPNLSSTLKIMKY